MADTNHQNSEQNKDMLSFQILRSSSNGGARLGKLAINGRKTLDTPHYIGHTSRGVISHLSHDTFRNKTRIDGVYVALEDFTEKLPSKTPPIFDLNVPEGQSVLRHFISIPEHHPIILGARRSPAIISPAANTRDAVSVYTSVGFRQITSENYTAAAQKLKPDIVVALGDIPYGPKPSLRRADRMGDRTLKWLGDIISAQGGLDKTVKTKVFNIFAPILPISRELQRWYLDHMLDDHLEHISGLAFYDCDNAYDLPDELVNLPRLSFCEPSTPHRLLYEISLGMDVLVIPFINESTDAGIALDFTFPQPNKSKDSAEIKAPLGTDMWSETHALDLKPLREGCECYSCKTHHRAYIQHLLAAKEMLAWVLIQIHNYHVIDQFFASVRSSIANGTFEEDCKTFQLNYEPEMPVQTGQGPRIRGYQHKSEGPSEGKKNAPAYKTFENKKEVNAEADPPEPDGNAAHLEKIGFAETKSR